MTEWTKDKEKRILLKYRLTLTFRILRVILFCFLLYAGYSMITNFIFGQTNMSDKHVFYSELALDWTQPNLQTDLGGTVNKEITPFWTQKISYSVYRVIGTKSYYVGEVSINKPVLTSFANMQIKLIPQNNQENRYVFSLPENPKTGKKYNVRLTDPSVWDVLNKVDKGTVADMSFSTTRYLSPEDLIKLLKPYDLHILWMPLYTGELKNFDPGYAGSSDTLSVPNFGLAGGRGKDRSGQWKDTYLREENLKQSEGSMLKNMKNLLKNESKTYYESFLGLYYLPERYDYLQKYGFQAYGAVVTGPVKELLKLKNVKEIRDPHLGDLEFWNWENE